MQAFTIATCVCIFASSIVAYTYATVGGQYSVNVHFVPPLVTAQCQIASFWSPQNVTCALCFCMTGSLSRCIPRPSCSPLAQNSTTNSTTGSPGNSTTDSTGNSTMPTEGDSPNAPGEPAPGGSVTQPSTLPAHAEGDETTPIAPLPPQEESAGSASKVRTPKERRYYANVLQLQL